MLSDRAALFPVLMLALACSSAGEAPSRPATGGTGGWGGGEPSSSGGAKPVGGAGGAPVAETAQLKVHVLAATLKSLDAASIYTEAQIEDYIAGCNTVFEPTGIRWAVSDLVVQTALDEDAVSQSIDTGTPKPGVALALNVDHRALLAPNGWDAIVVRKTAPLGFGGVYKCSLDPMSGVPGAVFVPLQAGNGSPQAMRKWAHELGHMMGLPHTECSEAFADNLMMSGTCEHANAGRVALTAEQIAVIQTQYAIGGPYSCGN